MGAPRRMPAAPPPLRPPRGASVPAPAPLPSQPRPRGPQRRRLRELLEEGGAWLGGGHVARTGPGCSREEGAAAAAPPGLCFPGPGRERGRRVPGTGRARSGSGSAARRLGPHVTGGGAACSRHRPRGGRPVRGRGAWLGAGHLAGTCGEWVLAAHARPRALVFGFVGSGSLLPSSLQGFLFSPGA